MFTGIVQELAPVIGLERESGLMRLELGLSEVARSGLEDGASVAVNGVCLTVARRGEEAVGFDVIAETLRCSNLGALEGGDRVNVERSAAFGDEIGGHRVSGHVTATAPVLDVRQEPGQRVLRLGGEPDWLRYVFYKGFIALDGASLTVSALSLQEGWLEVSLIPETLARTTFGFRARGQRVNVEVDPESQAVVATVERLFSDPAWRARVLTE